MDSEGIDSQTFVGKIEESRKGFSEFRDLLDTINDHVLNDSRQFSGMPAEWKPWQVIAGNTHEHYDDHAIHARKWFSHQSSGAKRQKGSDVS